MVKRRRRQCLGAASKREAHKTEEETRAARERAATKRSECACLCKAVGQAPRAKRSGRAQRVLCGRARSAYAKHIAGYMLASEVKAGRGAEILSASDHQIIRIWKWQEKVSNAPNHLLEAFTCRSLANIPRRIEPVSLQSCVPFLLKETDSLDDVPCNRAAGYVFAVVILTPVTQRGAYAPPALSSLLQLIPPGRPHSSRRVFARFLGLMMTNWATTRTRRLSGRTVIPRRGKREAAFSRWINARMNDWVSVSR
ncbi:hypothetical protein U1Q18_051442 [Sarracenia purpurea var. burkii]